MPTLVTPPAGTVHPLALSWRQKASAIWRESRPGVQLVFLLRSVAPIGVGHMLSPRDAALPLAWLMLTVAAYVFNGVSDIDGDRRNGSTRPLASGRLRSSEALGASVVLACVGLAISGLLAVVDLLVGLLFVGLGWAYSAGPRWKLGSFSASAVIGAGAGLTYVAALAVQGGRPLREYVLPLLIAVWVGLASNSKDLSDADGDAHAGRRTLPVVLGPARAARIVAATTVAGGCGIGVLTLVADPAHATVGTLIAIGSLGVGVMAWRTGARHRADSRRRSYRIFMITQYALNLAMLAGM